MLKTLERLLAAWGTFLVLRRRLIFWVILGFAAACLPVAYSTLRHLDANLLNQVSDRLPRFKALKEITTDFGGDILVAVVSIPPEQARLPQKVAELKAFGDLLTTELAKAGTDPEDIEALKKLPAAAAGDETHLPWLRRVECQMGAGLRAEFTRAAKDYPHLLLGSDEIAEINRRFEPAALQSRLKDLREELAGLDPNGLERMKLLRDPLDLTGLMQEKIHRKLQLQNLGSGKDDYLISPDGTTLLVLTRPARTSNNVAYNRVLILACQRAENRALRAYRMRTASAPLTTALKSDDIGQFAESNATPDLTIGFTGLHAMSVENERSLKKDVLEGTLVAFLALVVIFFVAYRSVRLTLNITLTLGIAAIVTLACAGVIHGQIGILGAGFTSILIGTGVDYGIMVYGTFRKMKEQHGVDSRTAIARTIAQRGAGLIIACFTSVVGFWGLTIVDFQAIAEFGLLTGIGLAVSAFLMFVFFPLLLIPRDGQPEFVTRPITPLGFGVLGRFLATPTGKRFGLIAGAAVALLCLGLLLSQPELPHGTERFLGVRFDPDIGNMRNRAAPASLLRDRVVQKFGRAFADLRIIVEASNELDAIKASEEIQARTARFVQEGAIRSGGSLVEFVPSIGCQQEILAQMKSMDMDAKSTTFLKAAETEFGANARTVFEPFTKSLHEFAETAGKAKVVSLREFMNGPLGPLLAPYARIDNGPNGTRVRLVSYFFPKDLEYTEEWLRTLASVVEDPPPAKSAVRLAAARFVGFELKRSVIQDMEWIFAGVALVVAVIVLYPMRSLKLSLLSVIPLAFSFLFVLAGVSFSERTGGDLSLNYISLMIFPILLGSAVDYGIYMVLDMYSGRFKGIQEVLEETGHSLLLCCGTTLGGYGSMIIGSNSGMISFGWTALLGYSGALFASIIVLPALYGGSTKEEVKASTLSV